MAAAVDSVDASTRARASDVAALVSAESMVGSSGATGEGRTGAEPPGTVVLEHARGFKLHDRLLRPAMVGVASAAPAPAGGAGEG